MSTSPVSTSYFYYTHVIILLMSHQLIKELVSDILSLDDIMFSVNSGNGICEVRI